MFRKIAAWVRNPALAFREQTWNQKRTNLEFLEAKYGEWFMSLPPMEKEKITDAFMNLQRNRLWVARNILLTFFTLIALFFLKRKGF